MTNVIYAVVDERYSFGKECRTSYGIVAYSNAEENGSSTIVASVHDIISERADLVKLVDECNRLKLSTVHLCDVVEDFLIK